MNDLGQRIQQLRKELRMSQTDLADKIGISYAQVGRYETKGAQPPAEVLKKMADTLDTSVDFLINGDTGEKAKATLKNTELLRHFKAMDRLPEQEQGALLKVISAYIRDFNAKQAYVMA